MENVGPRSATLRPHIPRRGIVRVCYAKGGLTPIMITGLQSKERSKNQPYHCQGTRMNGTHAKSEVLKVRCGRENVFPVNRKFRSPSRCAVEPFSLRIRRIGIWDFSCVLGIYIVKVPPLPSIQLRSKSAFSPPGSGSHKLCFPAGPWAGTVAGVTSAGGGGSRQAGVAELGGLLAPAAGMGDTGGRGVVRRRGIPKTPWPKRAWR